MSQTFGRKEHKPSVLNRRDELGQRSETVRRANLSVILRELHTRGALSRSELVARTGSDPQRDPRPDRRAGRERTRVRDARRSPRHARPAVPARLTDTRRSDGPGPRHRGRFDRGGHRRPRWRDHRRDPGRPAAAALIGRPGRRRPRRAGRDPPARRSDHPDARIGIGVAVVGVVRRSDGVVSMAPNLGWVDVGLRDELVRMFGDDVPIHVANEADLGALAEARRGAAVGADHILYLSGEVGVGGGIIVDGEPFIGAAGYGGEVGHMPVNPAGLPCRCGSIGCWETEAGSQSLLRRAGRVATGGRDAIDELLARGRGGLPRRPGRPRGDRAMDRDRPGRPRQPARSAARRVRRAVRPDPSVRRSDRRGGARSSCSRGPSTTGADRPIEARRRGVAARRRGARDGTTPGRSGQVDASPRDVDARLRA